MNKKSERRRERKTDNCKEVEQNEGEEYEDENEERR
jgi:hypothetical protein